MDSYTENDIKKGQAAPDLFGVAKKIPQTVSAVFAFWIPQTLSEELLTLWILGRTSWKIRFYIEKAIFLSTFFDKKLQIIIVFPKESSIFASEFVVVQL